jgi:hypothetical protein
VDYRLVAVGKHLADEEAFGGVPLYGVVAAST